MLYRIEHLICSYDRPYTEGKSRKVLQIDSLQIPRGKKIFIVGESGIGKSTILEVLGMMNNTIVPNPHSVFTYFDNGNAAIDLIRMWNDNDDNVLSEFRRGHFSFIFQSTNLMKNFTAFENVSITRMLQGYNKQESFAKTHRVLSDLGLAHIGEERMAQELSGGQQQRLAFARAIVPDFSVLFGDEPTGNLDEENANRTMDLLSAKLTEIPGSTAIIVSHNMHQAVTYGDEIIKIQKVVDEKRSTSDEVFYYGLINQDSIFVRKEDAWSNGLCNYTSAEFEKYLKKG